jgi:hypothetical protein
LYAPLSGAFNAATDDTTNASFSATFAKVRLQNMASNVPAFLIKLR